MSTAVMTNRLDLASIADGALKTATRVLFGVTFAGQLVFAFAVASFYGLTAARGDQGAWNRFMTHGHVPGDRAGNAVVAVHLGAAVVIILAGMLQLVPGIRELAPSFHRWAGRLYIATAFALSLAGLYMMWVRGSIGDLPQHLANSLMAVLIMLCAAQALRYALVRNFRAHRVWALRLYLVVSGSLFIRATIFLSFLINGGPFGFDPATFSGPFLTFVSFAQYLVPLGILELYLRTKTRAGATGRLAMATGLLISALALGVGVFAVTMSVWAPAIKSAFDGRKSIANALMATIGTKGVDAAAEQYHAFTASEAASAYNFDESELNTLGYELLRAKKIHAAVRIFQLNVEAYPSSSNTYDSLGEAYMNGGDKAQAIASYRQALALNPRNGNSAAMLRKLEAP